MGATNSSKDKPKASLAAFPVDEALAFEPELFMLASPVEQKTGREKAFT